MHVRLRLKEIRWGHLTLLVISTTFFVFFMAVIFFGSSSSSNEIAGAIISGTSGIMSIATGPFNPSPHPSVSIQLSSNREVEQENMQQSTSEHGSQKQPPQTIRQVDLQTIVDTANKVGYPNDLIRLQMQRYASSHSSWDRNRIIELYEQELVNIPYGSPEWLSYTDILVKLYEVSNTRSPNTWIQSRLFELIEQKTNFTTASKH
jgi:hypothetical protein